MVDEARKKKRFTLKRIVLSAVSFIAVVIVVGLFITTRITVDKVIITPGDAQPTSGAIQYENVQTFAPDGTIRFLTVLVSSKKPSYADYWVAKHFTDHAEILPWKDVNGDQTPQESNELNQALMKQSQSAAKVVALNTIGCDVTESGTGAMIAYIEKGSPASAHLKKGDTMVEIDGQEVTLNSNVSKIIRDHKPGDTISVVVERGKNDEKKTYDITLAESPYSPGAAFLGVQMVTRDQEFSFPITISIDPGAVSGPSAGTAFTLSMIDELTKGELTGGKDIAVTGEISLDGSVEQVGGVEQKAIAARRAGAKIMIVPRGEGKDARKGAGSMKVFEVSTISQALDVLKSQGGDPLPQMQSCPTSE